MALVELGEHALPHAVGDDEAGAAGDEDAVVACAGHGQLVPHGLVGVGRVLLVCAGRNVKVRIAECPDHLLVGLVLSGPLEEGLAGGLGRRHPEDQVHVGAVDVRVAGLGGEDGSSAEAV